MREKLSLNLKNVTQRSRSLGQDIGAVLTVCFLVSPVLAASDTDAGVGKIPRLASGKPDFSGIWQTTSAADQGLEPHEARKGAPPSAGVVEGDVIPYTAEALEKKKKNYEARATADPRLKCWTLGTPRGIYYPEPFQVFQRAQDVTVFFEFGHSVRATFMTRRCTLSSVGS